MGTHIHCIPLPGALGLPQGKTIMVLAGQDNIPTMNDNIGKITDMRKKNTQDIWHKMYTFNPSYAS